jgi:hypothetical protein
MRFKYNILRKCNYQSVESDKDFIKLQNFRNDEWSSKETISKINSLQRPMTQNAIDAN